MIFFRQYLLRSIQSDLKSNLAAKINMATPTKIARMTKPLIGTHDSTFHCDDVTACYMLKQLDRFRNHDIIRTRDPEALAEAEIIVDVGGEFDAERLRLDHHQRSFNMTIKDFYPKFKTTNPEKPPRLSSAGLVYVLFGKELIVKKLNLGSSFAALDDDKKKMVEAIYEKAYVEFMEEIDAIDNGVEVASGDNLVYNYHVNSGISSRVGRVNPIGNTATPEERLVLFKKAMELVGAELSEGLHFLGTIWWPKRQQFHEFVLKRKEFDESGQLVLIESDHLVGWKSALLELEEELGIVGELKYIVFQGERQWRATAVPVSLKSFNSRVPLKEEWRGKRDEDLQQVSGVADANFVHMSGFTGGATSLEGMKRMCRKSLGLE